MTIRSEEAAKREADLIRQVMPVINPGWREFSDGSGMFTSSGDAEADARYEANHRRWEANESEGLCPNGCGPLEWVDAHNTHCPKCNYSGWTNVPNKGRVEVANP